MINKLEQCLKRIEPLIEVYISSRYTEDYFCAEINPALDWSDIKELNDDIP